MWIIPAALLAAILPVAVGADVCGDLVFMQLDADGWVCVTPGSVEGLERLGFYAPEVPLPMVKPGDTPLYACPGINYTFDDGDVSWPEASIALQAGVSHYGTSTQAAPASEYSTTNIQEVGVDEPDIIKNTGTDIFVSGDRINILRAYPPGDAAVLGHSPIAGEMLLYGDRLAVFESGGDTKITILDVSNRTDPRVTGHALMTGSMSEARIINDTIYVITQDDPDRTPSIRYGQNTLRPDTYYFPHYLADIRTTISAVSLESGSVDAMSFLTSFDAQIYASQSSIYFVIPGINYVYTGPGWMEPGTYCAADSKIAKIRISGADISYGGEGEVPGYPIDQFAMSEKDDTFRIATTTWSGVNSAFKLNETLDITGMVFDIAPGETMHSARFYGDTLYLVTFRQVDPFFVVDFSGDPEVLGELKLPGFSEYLHPYDQNTIVGVGRETLTGQWGPIRDGVKVTVFDVSDPADPTLADFTVIGDDTAFSYITYDHKAALISQRVISIPVSFEGFTTFHVFDIQNGTLVKKGTIQHPDADWARSLYIGNHLYTVTPDVLKITDLDGLVFVNSVQMD